MGRATADRSAKPRIAVILDENTSGDGRRYEAAKGYFNGIRDAGGLPFGVPYFPEIVDAVLSDFDGVLSVGGRFAYPSHWYADGAASNSPLSERLAVEQAIVRGCLDRSKPVLGICAGMQMIACLNGCRLSPDLSASHPSALEHDKRDFLHPVTLKSGSRLERLVGAPRMLVNTFHREAVVELTNAVEATAHAEDGIVEAIEVPGHPFALGIQWHQELFVGSDHPGNAIFAGLISAC
jgi:putative glutamine amidotransferase